MPSTIVLRSFESSDRVAADALNSSAIPAVNGISAELWDWFTDVGWIQVVDSEEHGLSGLLVALPPGLHYASDNYRWFTARFDRGFFYVDRIVVASSLRGSGWGTNLYQAVFEEAQRRGLPRVCCEVNVKPLNEASLRFHAKLGFEPLGQQDTEGGCKRVELLSRELG